MTRIEQQELADRVYKRFDLVNKPKVVHVPYKPYKKLGYVNVNTGIILMKDDAGLDVLLHELAHLDKEAARALDHGKCFRSALAKINHAYINEYIYKTSKI